MPFSHCIGKDLAGDGAGGVWRLAGGPLTEGVEIFAVIFLPLAIDRIFDPVATSTHATRSAGVAAIPSMKAVTSA
jgi:hypothetical protein